jgi:protein-disulfide isomerase
MRQIWLAVAAFVLAASAFGPAAAQEPGPALAPEDHVLGKDDAPITIIEYASLTCPHCAEFDRETLPKLKAGWIDTGKAKLVFRIFPLNGLDLRAAMLASCAPPERYYAFIDTLYQSQNNWTRASDPMQALGNIGRLGGVSEERFKQCMADEKLQQSIVAQGFAASKSYGVESTPTFFINGARMNPNGAQPIETFDKALTAAQPKT